jgi:penicillin-insensitive murein endopeptidase
MNLWLMGLLAAAFSALAGAGATSWWESQPAADAIDDVEVSHDGELPDDAEDAGDRSWLNTLPTLPEVDVVHPLAALDDEELEAMVLRDPASLGSMSVGAPNAGALFNGVQLPESPLWKLADPAHAWGTRESIDFVAHAITRVNEYFPGSPVLYVGDFSAPQGGKLRPHKSHQSGRDVDIGHYYSTGSAWYKRATSKNLDRARTWALLETLLTESRVQYVFMDRSIQPLLKEYALAQGEDPEWLSRVFEGPSNRDPIVRHRFGHATHMHVRFENPTAELTARRSYPLLQKAGLVGGAKKKRLATKQRRAHRRAVRAKAVASAPAAVEAVSVSSDADVAQSTAVPSDAPPAMDE